MTKSQTAFFELLQIAVGNRDTFSVEPTADEWAQIYNLAQKQSLVGITLEGANRLATGLRDSNRGLVLEWIGQAQLTVSMNNAQNERAKELCALFKDAGFRCCILKGQGTALYYDQPDYRQCGDIDVWIEGDRDEILSFLREKGYKIGHIDIKHSDVAIFEDVPVEVHFLPSWMYFPSSNKRLQRFFNEKADSQFSNYDEAVGFVHTTIDFDLVFSMVHIYRHIFSEGIGLRQLMDYYYILIRSTKEQRTKAYKEFKKMRMSSFVGGVLWVLKECYGLKDEYLFCAPNERHGKFLLSEIMTGGNFGHYDERTHRVGVNKKFKRGFAQLGRNLRFVSYYPSEVLWSPFWKLWHYCWRKKKGYL